MVRLACELADGQAASLFLVDGGILRPYILYNLPKEYVAGIGTVEVGTQCCGRAVTQKLAYTRPALPTPGLQHLRFVESAHGKALHRAGHVFTDLK